jgi:hypothetical protein
MINDGLVAESKVAGLIKEVVQTFLSNALH